MPFYGPPPNNVFVLIDVGATCGLEFLWILCIDDLALLTPT
jgi:hypothetical protein